MKNKGILPLLMFYLVLTLVNNKIYADNKASEPNAEMNKVLQEMEAKKIKPIESLKPKEARKQPLVSDAVESLMKKEKIKPQNSRVTEETIQVDGAAGKIPATVYAPPGKDIKPIVVYFHGGGFVLAENEDYEATPKSLAEKTNAIFVSVEYRKAPEHKFPAAHEDAFAAYKWVLANAGALGGDPKKVAVAGESAGGNLALNVAIRARDEKIQVPVHQLIVYPIAGNYMRTNSYKENANAKPLSRGMMEWFFANTFNDPSEAKDQRINLLTANFLSLAPTTIITAEIDPLRSEGRELAEKMREQNVDVEYKHYKGVTHEFFGMAPVLQEARNAQDFAAKEMKKAFKRL